MALVAVALMVAMPSQAQVKFGLKGGVNVTNMKWNRDVLDASNRAGFYIGPTIKFTLPILGLGVDASALYDQRSAKVNSSSMTLGTGGQYGNEGSDILSPSEETITQKQIAVPINLRYGFGLGETAGIFVYAGPQFGFNVGGDEKLSVANVDWKWKDSNFSMNVGIGAMLLTHLQINANYNIACGKSGEISGVGDAITTSAKNVNAKSNSWQIGLAYYF